MYATNPLPRLRPVIQLLPASILSASAAAGYVAQLVSAGLGTADFINVPRLPAPALAQLFGTSRPPVSLVRYWVARAL